MSDNRAERVLRWIAANGDTGYTAEYLAAVARDALPPTLQEAKISDMIADGDWAVMAIGRDGQESEPTRFTPPPSS